MNRVVEQIIIAAKETPRAYFAPLIGAYRGIKREYKILAYMESRKHRHTHLDR